MIRRTSFRRLAIMVSLMPAALVLLAVGAAAYPAMAAAACPTCYGFERLERNLFVEKGMSTADQAHTAAIIADAQQRVASFYGELTSSPRTLICGTQECYDRIGGGGSRGMALLDFALALSPRGTDTVIAAHELSHIELHSRLGLVRTYFDAVPQWFDEGMAVVVSDDPRYLSASGSGDRCLVEMDEHLPTTRSEWIHGASNDELYAKAACQVSRWITSKGGTAAVVDLIDRVAQGAKFDSIYR